VIAAACWFFAGLVAGAVIATAMCDRSEQQRVQQLGHKLDVALDCARRNTELLAGRVEGEL